MRTEFSTKKLELQFRMSYKDILTGGSDVFFIFRIWTFCFQFSVFEHIFLSNLVSYNQPWEYDRETYKKRNQNERFFLRIKRFRRVFTRYDKLDIIFAGFILFVMIIDSIVWTVTFSQRSTHVQGENIKSLESSYFLFSVPFLFNLGCNSQRSRPRG